VRRKAGTDFSGTERTTITHALSEVPVSPANSKTLRLLAWSIGTTAILAAILSAAIVWLVERQHMEQGWVIHSRALHEQIAHALLVVQRMESNQRGDLLTGRDLYLGNYVDSEMASPALIDETAALIDGDPQQRERLADLRQVITEKAGELRSTIDEQQAGRRDAARAIVNSDRGIQMMDQIRQLFSEIRDEEDQILSSRQSALRKTGTLLQVGAPIPLLLIGVIGVLAHQYMRRSLSAIGAALRQREESQFRLQLAMDAAHLASWQYDPLSRVVSGDARFKEIVNVAENEVPINEIMERVNPNDMGKVWAAFNAVTATKTEFRLQGDGKICWVETLGLAHPEGVGAEREGASVVGTVADITERKHDEVLLRRHADLLDQSHDAILALRIDGRGIVYWNRGAERLYGYTAAEAAGRRTHELLRTRAPIPIGDIDAQVVQGGSWFGELTHTTRDGRDIVVDSRIVRVSYDDDIYALETNRDISERKLQEEREHLLMREMNHRAKNMLGLVQAIARQTATGSPEDFVERFSDRLQSLSANQELLFRNEWKGVDVASLVRAQLAHFADLIDSRIAVQGPMLRLQAAGAQAIGLALHELATNAGKHGALSAEAGRVDIRWETDGDTFTMGWVERDGPPVSAPTRRGFGTVVMKEMTERSLDGKIDLEYAPSGVTWRLTCPAANALGSNGDHRSPGRPDVTGPSPRRSERAGAAAPPVGPAPNR
jgi:PAS domain S-box-containing protein